MKPWFKHYNNARMKKTISALEFELGTHVGYACYFKFVELCHSMWNGKDEPIFTFSLSQIRKTLNLSSKKTEKFLEIMEEFLNISQKVLKVSEKLSKKSKNNEKFLEIEFHKLLEIQDKDARYNRKRVASGSHGATLDKEKDKEKEKDKDKEEEEERDTGKSSTPPINDVERFSLAYSKRFKEKYGKNPPLGQERVIMEILQKCEIETAIEAIDNFFNSKNSYYEHRAFTLNAMLGDIETLIVKANDKWGDNGANRGYGDKNGCGDSGEEEKEYFDDSDIALQILQGGGGSF